jgi:hypothetical protein
MNDSEENVKFWKAAEEFRALKDIDALRDRAKEVRIRKIFCY